LAPQSESIYGLRTAIKQRTDLLQLESGGGERYDKLYGEQSLCTGIIKQINKNDVTTTVLNTSLHHSNTQYYTIIIIIIIYFAQANNLTVKIKLHEQV